MGIRARNSSDRLRTNWTPDMDRYFIDLMLEQVGRGNRIDDHLFSKRAWKHMTALFNAKVGFQYEKDVLKNRHKTMRNLYKAIKKLLDQSGFSWDETRQMVTADNNVWDDYIKVHPDARSYRIKTVPYYSDLCLIYRNASIDGRENNSSHDTNLGDSALAMMISGELEGPKSPTTPVAHGELANNVHEFSSHSSGDRSICDQQSEQQSMTLSNTHPTSIGEGTVNALHETTTATMSLANNKEENDNGISKESVIDVVPDILDSTISNRSRTYWQPPMDRYFIDLMLDQVHKENQIDGLFRKQAWMDMIALFNAKFGFKYDMDVLKNRYKTLRRQYSVIKNLLDQSGFFWDESRQMVTADDYVWQDHIKAHTDARQYMTRPVPYYNDLCVICRDLDVDGRGGMSGHGADQQDEVLEVKLGGLLRSPESPALSLSHENRLDHLQESSQLSGDIYLSDQKIKHQLKEPSTSQRPKKVQRGNNESMVDALREMATAVSSLADKRKENENSNTSIISIENVIDAVQAIPDIDEDLLLDAFDFLEDEKKAKIFLALDIKLRKKWLMRKLRPQKD
ncbi:hypothetical protein HHK36_031504 [Tetracentron sinense]|uniref:L10-interacting MYB domain-containing protein n=1 Tax=Tetracentron sinense TaxID=13715 RepID=A0A834Y6T7_TETSI|nr:hypothetical protein HHK36_031504 [Tetracentron sinense]